MKKLFLFARDGSIKAVTKVDDKDYEWLSKWKWCCDNDGYAIRIERIKGTNKSKGYKLHRVIMGLEHGDQRTVDHRNLDKLDNQRHNLRIATRKQNQQNLPSYNESTSKYRGVSWNTAAKKWKVDIVLNGKNNYLGYYNCEKEAAIIADNFRMKEMPFSEPDKNLDGIRRQL